MRTILGYTAALLSITALALLISCKRDPCAGYSPTEYTTINLTADEQSKVPYTGYDTLYFLTNTGDTCIVRGTGKQYFYETVLEKSEPVCPPVESRNYQAYKLHYYPLRGKLDFVIEQHSSIDFGQVLLIRLKDADGVFRVGSDRIGVIPDWNDSYYIDSLEINQKTFRTIRIMESNISRFQKDSNVYILYNKQYGILKFENRILNEVFTILN